MGHDLGILQKNAVKEDDINKLRDSINTVLRIEII